MIGSATRKIIHIDMDSFFVSVEIRDNPDLKDKIVAVGGQPGKRGVIATCNYRAREFGVRSAMSSTRAKKLCPDLIIVPGNIDKYKQVSSEIHAVFKSFTDLVEPLSLDEAYLDVTNVEQYQGSATLIAEEIRSKIFEKTQLTASAGVGPNKLVAKIASDANKPNGICVVPPSKVLEFVSSLPVERLYGVGRSKLAKLKKMGLTTCQDLQKIDKEQLNNSLGKFGDALYDYCRGIDDRPVSPDRIRKSISVEQTYEQDINDLKLLEQHIATLIIKLKKRMKPVMEGRAIKSIFVKVKFRDFKQTTAESQVRSIELDTVIQLFKKAYSRQGKPVRLLGLGLGLEDANQNTAAISQLDFDFTDKCNPAMRQFLESANLPKKDII